MIAFDTPFISKKLTKIQETIQQPKYLSSHPLLNATE